MAGAGHSRTSVVTVLVSRLMAVTEPRLCALLPPPSQAVRPQPTLTARHSALGTRGTTSSLIRHNISPEFSRSKTCTRHRRDGRSKQAFGVAAGVAASPEPRWVDPVDFPSNSPSSEPGSPAREHSRSGSPDLRARPCTPQPLSNGVQQLGCCGYRLSAFLCFTRFLEILPYPAAFAVLRSRQTRWGTSCHRRSARHTSAGRRAAGRRRRRQPAGCTPRCPGRLLEL